VSATIGVVQVGLGALGRRLTPYLVERRNLRIVAAVDTDAALLGRDLGDISGLGRSLGIEVADRLDPATCATQPQVAVHTTVSSLAEATAQIASLLDQGIHVVSSCEELSFPWQAAPDLAGEIDRQARAVGLAVLGTGVNPGFLMDFLPTALTAICRDVCKVTVLRYQDARFRRLPFQQKIGAGLTPEEFDRKKADGSLRHVGLTESMHLIADRLGWRLDRTEDIIEPVIADARIASEHLTVEPGRAAGVYQRGLAYQDGEEKIQLEFRACLGEAEVQDTVIIDGTPSLRFTIPDGVNGDVATCAILTNAIPSVLTAPPGLRTMADVPAVSWFSGLTKPRGPS
jgi:hypothetical protein